MHLGLLFVTMLQLIPLSRPSFKTILHGMHSTFTNHQLGPPFQVDVIHALAPAAHGVWKNTHPGQYSPNNANQSYQQDCLQEWPIKSAEQARRESASLGTTDGSAASPSLSCMPKLTRQPSVSVHSRSFCTQESPHGLSLFESMSCLFTHLGGWSSTPR